MHVNADWENCFLILITPADTVEPEAYLLFDIGAEYRELTLTCPTLQLEDAVSDALIEESIRNLPGREDPFAILDAGEGTYLQTFAEEEEGFHIEHQLVSTASHYALPELVPRMSPSNCSIRTRLGKKNGPGISNGIRWSLRFPRIVIRDSPFGYGVPIPFNT